MGSERGTTAAGAVLAAGLAAGLALGCGGETSAGGEPAPPDVQMVGRGIVSTVLPEFATTLSPDGDTIWFNRTPADRSRLELFHAVRSGDGWGEARVFGPTAGETAIDPFFAPDGRLYFSSDRPMPGAARAGAFNLWYVERTPDGWGTPVPLPASVNSDSSDVFNSLARDGTMVFSSTRDGERRVYETRRTADGWTDPVGIRFGDVTAASNPAIAPDGRWLVVAARPGGGPPDLHVSCREPGGWGPLHRLADPINSPFADFAPGIGASHLWFTSERPGVVGAVADSIRPPGDLYRVPIAAVAALCREDGR